MQVKSALLLSTICPFIGKVLILHLETEQNLMKKLTIISLATLCAASMFTGCNSDFVPADNTSSSVAVYSFSLSANDSVLANLDTVFFSIDLERAHIFNADSLPYGTRTDKLVPRITTAETAAGINIIVPLESGIDTVYNFVTNPDDTIDFSRGPVYLEITSSSGTANRRYTVDVNVHKVKSDSLVWSTPWQRELPGTLGHPTQQRTVHTADAVYTLSTDGSNYSMATAAAPDAQWTSATVDMPSGVRIETLSATDDALYILDKGCMLYRSDDGMTWQSTGESMYSIYGGYGSRLLGVRNNNGVFEAAEYPANVSTEKTLPDGMPVSGTSVPLAFSFPMSSSQQIIVVGGRTAEGILSPHTWGFDGNSWARISVEPLPEGLAGVSVVPFFTFKVNALFIANEYSVLLAFGGQGVNGLSRTVYMSWDYGMKWVEGGKLIQLPAAIPSMQSAQAYVYERTFDADGELKPLSRGHSLWQALDYSPRVPFGALDRPLSRATEPVESWDCPYIYLFGGYDRYGALQPYVWRGTINRLSFKPLI